MKILVLTKKYPYPQRDGECIAIHTLASGLRASGAELDLLSMNPLRDEMEAPEEGSSQGVFHRVFTFFMITRNGFHGDNPRNCSFSICPKKHNCISIIV